MDSDDRRLQLALERRAVYKILGSACRAFVGGQIIEADAAYWDRTVPTLDSASVSGVEIDAAQLKEHLNLRGALRPGDLHRDSSILAESFLLRRLRAASAWTSATLANDDSAVVAAV